MPWKRLTGLGLSVVVCGLLCACGSDTPATPGTGGPTPSAAGSPAASAGFLHVLAAMRLTSYRIDATGRLLGTADQPMVDVHQITGEPQGRFVFMAYGPRDHKTSQLRSIVSYVANEHDGSLTAVSEGSSVPDRCGTSWWAGDEWISFAAGVDRVYGIWLCSTYHDDYWYFVTRPVTSDGQLGPESERSWDDDSGQEGSCYNGVFDVRSNVLYKEGPGGSLAAHAIGADGRLTLMGGTTSCVARHIYGGQPLVAVRGFLFAQTSLGYQSGRPESVCSYEGPRLAPRRDLGFSATKAAGLDPGVDSEPARVAFPVTIPAASGHPVRYELRVFTLAADGSPQLQDTLETADEVQQVLFHPSGRFLFASVGTALWVYTVAPDGHLTKTHDLPGAAGRLAVTLGSNEDGGAAR